MQYTMHYVESVLEQMTFKDSQLWNSASTLVILDVIVLYIPLQRRFLGSLGDAPNVFWIAI